MTPLFTGKDIFRRTAFERAIVFCQNETQCGLSRFQKQNVRVDLAITNNFWHPSVHDQSYNHKLFVAVNKQWSSLGL